MFFHPVSADVRVIDLPVEAFIADAGDSGISTDFDNFYAKNKSCPVNMKSVIKHSSF